MKVKQKYRLQWKQSIEMDNLPIKSKGFSLNEMEFICALDIYYGCSVKDSVCTGDNKARDITAIML